jgi:hypothetical protein
MNGTFEVCLGEKENTTNFTVQAIKEYSVQNHLPSITENFLSC